MLESKFAVVSSSMAFVATLDSRRSRCSVSGIVRRMVVNELNEKIRSVPTAIMANSMYMWLGIMEGNLRQSPLAVECCRSTLPHLKWCQIDC